MNQPIINLEQARSIVTHDRHNDYDISDKVEPYFKALASSTLKGLPADRKVWIFDVELSPGVGGICGYSRVPASYARSKKETAYRITDKDGLAAVLNSIGSH